MAWRFLGEALGKIGGLVASSVRGGGGGGVQSLCSAINDKDSAIPPPPGDHSVNCTRQWSEKQNNKPGR